MLNDLGEDAGGGVAGRKRRERGKTKQRDRKSTCKKRVRSDAPLKRERATEEEDVTRGNLVVFCRLSVATEEG